MLLNAVIAKSTQHNINYILKTGNIYAACQTSNNLSHEIRFYKTEESAIKNYPRTIKGIIFITIDTADMKFFGENEIPITLTPQFTETDSEYIFTFDKDIKDLHYYCPIINNKKNTNIPKLISTQESHMTEEYINQKMFELAKRIDYKPKDISFLKAAMYCQITHKKDDGKHRKNYTNDRYATLGDTILKFVLTEYLFDKERDKDEITQEKERIERNSTLYALCEKHEIFRYAYNDSYFYDDAPQQNKVPHSNHDVYIEAIIAAIYKDKGIDYCKKWIITFLQKNDML